MLQLREIFIVFSAISLLQLLYDGLNKSQAGLRFPLWLSEEGKTSLETLHICIQGFPMFALQYILLLEDRD